MVINGRRWFFETINKTDMPLSKLTKRQSQKIQINKIRNEKRGITTETKEIQRIIMTNFINLYSTKLENLKQIGNFLNTWHLRMLNQYKKNQFKYASNPW